MGMEITNEATYSAYVANDTKVGKSDKKDEKTEAKSKADASETTYDYSFVVPIHVNRNDLLDSLCLSSGDDIYFINS